MYCWVQLERLCLSRNRAINALINSTSFRCSFDQTFERLRLLVFLNPYRQILAPWQFNPYLTRRACGEDFDGHIPGVEDVNSIAPFWQREVAEAGLVHPK